MKDYKKKFSHLHSQLKMASRIVGAVFSELKEMERNYEEKVREEESFESPPVWVAWINKPVFVGFDYDVTPRLGYLAAVDIYSEEPFLVRSKKDNPTAPEGWYPRCRPIKDFEDLLKGEW